MPISTMLSCSNIDGQQCRDRRRQPPIPLAEGMYFISQRWGWKKKVIALHLPLCKVTSSKSPVVQCDRSLFSFGELRLSLWGKRDYRNFLRRTSQANNARQEEGKQHTLWSGNTSWHVERKAVHPGSNTADINAHIDHTGIHTSKLWLYFIFGTSQCIKPKIDTV